MHHFSDFLIGPNGQRHKQLKRELRCLKYRLDVNTLINQNEFPSYIDVLDSDREHSHNAANALLGMLWNQFGACIEGAYIHCAGRK